MRLPPSRREKNMCYTKNRSLHTMQQKVVTALFLHKSMPSYWVPKHCVWQDLTKKFLISSHSSILFSNLYDILTYHCNQIIT